MEKRMMFDPIKILEKYSNSQKKALKILLHHGRLVKNKALEIAEHFTLDKIDLKFIEEAAILHDIGIFFVNAPEIGCYGDKPYIAHGYLGREVLEKEGLPKHALAAERHTGMGIHKEEIINLPLPYRDFIPISWEEKILCYADKFYSKNPERKYPELTLKEIEKHLREIGEEKWKLFEEWRKIFEGK